MDEKEVKNIIEGNVRRARELLKLIESQGVDIDLTHFCEHHFWVPTQEEASVLGRELYRRDFLVLTLCRVPTEDNSELWNVEAGRNGSPREAASSDSIEDLSRLGAKFNAEYDGWGVSIDAPE